MASDGYLLVQRRADGAWVGGHLGTMVYWIDERRIAWSFKSQRDFQRWCRRTLYRNYRAVWQRGELRFVRVRPRKEAA